MDYPLWPIITKYVFYVFYVFWPFRAYWSFGVSFCVQKSVISGYRHFSEDAIFWQHPKKRVFGFSTFSCFLFFCFAPQKSTFRVFPGFSDIAIFGRVRFSDLWPKNDHFGPTLGGGPDLEGPKPTPKPGYPLSRVYRSFWGVRHHFMAGSGVGFVQTRPKTGTNSWHPVWRIVWCENGTLVATFVPIKTPFWGHFYSSFCEYPDIVHFRYEKGSIRLRRKSLSPCM